MKCSIKNGLILFCLTVFNGTALAAKPTIVNCNDSGASIQEAINKIDSGGTGVIYIEGFCEESVTITTDNITIPEPEPEEDEEEIGDYPF